MDLAAIRIEAHSLKSLAASVGAMTIFGLARVTELAARDCDIGKVKQVLPLLIEEMKQMETELAAQFSEEERPLCEDRNLDDQMAVEIGTGLIQVIEEDTYETGTVYC